MAYGDAPPLPEANNTPVDLPPARTLPGERKGF
jgi:hypothetical protein